MSDDREQHFREFLDHRGVETPCIRCSGLGVRAYGSTATWRGGIGGQMITSDVCDRCWGSGDEQRRWTDLRAIRERVEQEIAARAVTAIANSCGASFSSSRESVLEIIEALDTLSRKRKLRDRWTPTMAKDLADLLRRAIKEGP